MNFRKVNNTLALIFEILTNFLLTSRNNSCKRFKGLIFLIIIISTRNKRRIMNSKEWRSKALSMCLIVATIATYSMVALAAADKVAGELLVSGNNNNSVIVNGEAAQSGRSIFSSSTIATPEDANATIVLGKIGNIKLDPNTTLTLSFSENGINGELLAGTVTVLNAENEVNIKMINGEVVKLKAGETATTGNAKAQDDDATNGGGGAWFIWALVLGGAAAGIVIAATTSNNDLNLGGGATVVSPSR
jgi:hypothetical protein